MTAWRSPAAAGAAAAKESKTIKAHRIIGVSDSA